MQIVEKNMRAKRQKERRKSGSLRSHVVKPKTLKRYREAVARFTAWLLFCQLSLPKGAARTDKLASDYVESLWENGDPKAWAVDLSSALLFFAPTVKGRLVELKRLCKAWSQLELPNRAPPFTILMVYGIAQWCVSQGYVDTAVLLVLGWDTFARSGELFLAKKSDFVFTGTSSAVWRLPLTKSGQRAGAEEAIVLDDPYVVRLLKEFLKQRNEKELLSAVSQQKQRERLQDACAHFGLLAGFRWYSLRRGGATFAFQQGTLLERICIRGRWAHTPTARIYINDGLAQLATYKISVANREALKISAAELRPSWKRTFFS